MTFPDDALLIVARSPLTDIFASPATLSVVVPAAIISKFFEIDTVDPLVISRAENITTPLLALSTGRIIELS